MIIIVGPPRVRRKAICLTINVSASNTENDVKHYVAHASDLVHKITVANALDSVYDIQSQTHK